ncbi:hypothetical protein [Nocardia cyriacigeorgica]|uniref:hypothetical protein n=1 Tax=Nocardia cyriacigeorgica TaxID=135487 RepID=UPI002455C5C5|nr:hypothetical protein [Nocardia cyriacigeorgica]
MYTVTYSPVRVAARRARLLGSDASPELRAAAELAPRQREWDYHEAKRRWADQARKQEEARAYADANPDDRAAWLRAYGACY